MKRNGTFYGVTMAELIVVISIFGFFMIGVYTIMDAGMKSWQIGETKSDLSQRALTSMNYIIKDLKYSTLYSLEIDNNGDPNQLNEYTCFETPVNNFTGTIDRDLNSFASPLWQGYILYYIYPRWKIDHSPDIKRNLYRHYKKVSTPVSIPFSLSSADILSSIDLTPPASSGNIIRTVAKEIYTIDFEQNSTSVTVTICFKKKPLKDAIVAHKYSDNPSSHDINELIEIKTSVIPLN